MRRRATVLASERALAWPLPPHIHGRQQSVDWKLSQKEPLPVGGQKKSALQKRRKITHKKPGAGTKYSRRVTVYVQGRGIGANADMHHF